MRYYNPAGAGENTSTAVNWTAIGTIWDGTTALGN